MEMTTAFIVVLVISLFFGFNAILAYFADHLPSWMLPKGYYDDNA